MATEAIASGVDTSGFAYTQGATTNTATAAGAPTEAHKGQPAEVVIPSDKLSERLKEERSKGSKTAEQELLKRLGFDSADAAMAKLKAWQAIEESQLSEQDKMKRTLDELAPKAARAAELEKVVEDMAATELANLPEGLRKSIEALDTDPAGILALISTFRENGVIRAMTAVSPQITPATTTAPPAGAPRSTSEPNKFEVHQQMLASGKVLQAGIYHQMHRYEIEKSRPA